MRRVATVRGHDHLRRGPGRGDDPGRRRAVAPAHRVEGRRARPRRLLGQAPSRLRDQAQPEGYYVVLQASAEPAAMDELHRVLSLADEVIRHKVLRIPEKVYGPPKAAGARGGHVHREERHGNRHQHHHDLRQHHPRSRDALHAERRLEGHLRRRREPLVAQPADPGVGGADQLLQRRRLASARRERRRVAQQGLARRRHRPARAAQLGDRAGREAHVVEIVADDVAPSLRFATAEVHQIERSGPATAAAAAAAAPAAPAPAAAAGAGGGDEQLRRLRRRAVLR